MSQSFGASNKPRERAFPEAPDPEFWHMPASRVLIVFLDFDGVLHPLGPSARRFERAPQLLTVLRAMERTLTPCSIVLSTNWRFQPRARIVAELDRAAPGLSAFLEGRTGARSDSGSSLGVRGSQAAIYLAARPGLEPLGALCFDDQRALFASTPGPAPERRDWLLLCDPARGLPPAGQLARTLRANAYPGHELLEAARLLRTGPTSGRFPSPASFFASGAMSFHQPGAPR